MINAILILHDLQVARHKFVQKTLKATTYIYIYIYIYIYMTHEKPKVK